MKLVVHEGNELLECFGLAGVPRAKQAGQVAGGQALAGLHPGFPLGGPSVPEPSKPTHQQPAAQRVRTFPAAGHAAQKRALQVCAYKCALTIRKRAGRSHEQRARAEGTSDVTGAFGDRLDGGFCYANDVSDTGNDRCADMRAVCQWLQSIAGCPFSDTGAAGARRCVRRARRARHGTRSGRLVRGC
jgi:hypothetical protein